MPCKAMHEEEKLHTVPEWCMERYQAKRIIQNILAAGAKVTINPERWGKCVENRFQNYCNCSAKHDGNERAENNAKDRIAGQRWLKRANQPVLEWAGRRWRRHWPIGLRRWLKWRARNARP